MADCLSCGNYTNCNDEKIDKYLTSGCKDYVKLRAVSLKYARVCKYCGKKHKRKGNMCSACKDKADLLPAFAKARDDLRRKCGLPPLEDNNDT